MWLIVLFVELTVKRPECVIEIEYNETRKAVLVLFDDTIGFLLHLRLV